ncbi:DUF1561 family protein [Helicobacter mustelae]|uniref:Uncharacterized protein n=1 Tax=Helicobacter mustelae (strain ATCC 43772 / CCUG 25715 / CIP 103759 / LMG 18044 / NCTC 12198 / R85-136P) TaxID=679897 RepID=D3UIY9_HELM1|nr:DUF1561 family protein [Helicobacter mustelae]CBG40464.1 Putative hypothetical protein [Helicobacter mustelae 12198]SQH71964.1 Protein of uncharacterised function (DUF1561) [Helicobacter mustelae]
MNFKFLFVGFLIYLLPLFAANQPIKVKLHDGKEYCYRPVFSGGEGLVYIDYCKNAPPAQYDVFGRVAWRVNAKWLCMSAPATVSGIGERINSHWGRLVLRPCVINDKNQQWIIKDGGFHTFDSRFRVKDDKWYAYISTKKGDKYDHSLSNIEQLQKIDPAVNLSLKTFLAWSFVSYAQFSLYYLQNNQSFQDSLVWFVYNPENGHIAQYNQRNGSQVCLTSKQGKADWGFVAWEDCSDKVLEKDNKYWEFFLLSGSDGAIKDKDGNFLRIAQYGPNWGVPYTSKKGRLEKDVKRSPKSLFLFSADIENWYRFVNANLSYSLSNCPPNKHRSKRTLPPNFSLNDEWKRRLWQIASSSDGSDAHSGRCGICLLQSYQILAELQSHHNSPLESGGYFFDTAPNTNPFQSFRQRNFILSSRLQEIGDSLEVPLVSLEDLRSRTIRAYHSMALVMLPNYEWEFSSFANTRDTIMQSLRGLFNAPVGTLWIANLYLRDAQGGNAGHAQPILRTTEGLLFIPTNTPNVSLQTYRAALERSLARNAEEAFRVVSTEGEIQIFLSMRLVREHQNPFNVLSTYNCTGLGEDRMGSGGLIRSQSINTCDGKRCLIQ